MNADKSAVQTFWDAASCGEVYAVGESVAEQFAAQARMRYDLEPFIPTFARFEDGAGKCVLEVGVGMGADHLEWARARPALLAGLDLSARAIGHTRDRFRAFGGRSLLQVGDAEQLPFAAESFDIVYSWGVLHHSPNTSAAVSELHRVLRPGGRASVMIYHRASLVGLLLWLRYGVRGRLPLEKVYAERLESPGTKAYHVDEALAMFACFSSAEATIELSPGDLLLGTAGQRHTGVALRLARRFWPRRAIRRLARKRGLFLLVTAYK